MFALSEWSSLTAFNSFCLLVALVEGLSRCCGKYWSKVLVSELAIPAEPQWSSTQRDLRQRCLLGVLLLGQKMHRQQTMSLWQVTTPILHCGYGCGQVAKRQWESMLSLEKLMSSDRHLCVIWVRLDCLEWTTCQFIPITISLLDLRIC